MQDVLRSAEGFLYIDHPLVGVQSLEKPREGTRLPQPSSEPWNASLFWRKRPFNASVNFPRKTSLSTGSGGNVRQLTHRADIAPSGSLRVITALEFVEHPFSKLGHRDLLMTHTVSFQADSRILHLPAASAAQAAQFNGI